MNLTKIAQVAVKTKDLQRATEFYRDKLGLKVLISSKIISVLDCGGITLLLGPNETGSLIYFDVDDIQKAVETLSGQGIKIEEEEISRQISRVPASKASTREELFRRLQLAREYIHGCADQSISLKEVSREAGLSRYHLHRTFTRVFRQTPHEYLTALRLERAHAFLKAGRTVTERCLEVGFSSPSSFSRLFSGRYGVPPSSVHKA